MKKIVIIGAGPAGLTAGLLLAEKGQTVTILEQNSQVGGLAKTVRYKGNRFDIGGHRFFAKYKHINDFWKKMLGKELLSVKRSSRLFYEGKFYHYPLQPKNALKNLGLWRALLATTDYLLVRLKPIQSEKTLEDVYINSFGRFLYRRFFEGYSTKLWGISPKKMEPDWGKARVGKLSLIGAIKDALFGSDIKSLIKKFHYPRLGPGKMWETVAAKMKQNGGEILLDSCVKTVFHSQNKITGVEVQTLARRQKQNVAHLISTMPIKDLVASLSPKPPLTVTKAAQGLKYRDYILVALIVARKNIFPDQWIYIQDPGFTNVRVQNVGNWSKAMVADKNKTILGVEYVTSQGEPLWQKSDQELITLASKEVVKLGFATKGQILEAKVVRELKAYPVYDKGYKQRLEIIKKYLSRFSNLALIGRNGMHKYNNMDHSMMAAQMAVENFFGAEHDLWRVNTDTEEYLESFKKR